MGNERFSEVQNAPERTSSNNELAPAQQESYKGFENFNSIKTSMTDNSSSSKSSLPDLQLVNDKDSQSMQGDAPTNNEDQSCKPQQDVPPEQMNRDVQDLTRHALEADRVWGDIDNNRRPDVDKNPELSKPYNNMADILRQYPPGQMNQAIEQLNRNLERQGANNRLSYDAKTDTLTHHKRNDGIPGDDIMHGRRNCALTS